MIINTLAIVVGLLLILFAVWAVISIIMISLVTEIRKNENRKPLLKDDKTLMVLWLYLLAGLAAALLSGYCSMVGLNWLLGPTLLFIKAVIVSTVSVFSGITALGLLDTILPLEDLAEDS